MGTQTARYFHASSSHPSTVINSRQKKPGGRFKCLQVIKMTHLLVHKASHIDLRHIFFNFWRVINCTCSVKNDPILTDASVDGHENDGGRGRDLLTHPVQQDNLFNSTLQRNWQFDDKINEIAIKSIDLIGIFWVTYLKKRDRMANEQMSTPDPAMALKFPPMNPTPRRTAACHAPKFGMESQVLRLCCLSVGEKGNWFRLDWTTDT